MGIFDTIKAAIFGSEAQASPAPTAGAVAASGAAPAGKPAATVDVAANLDALAKKSKEKFDWRKSIVDLMKLLDLDSSLNARKELAKELGYTGNMSDSATMNVWLHKQIMAKLAANGGKLPSDIKT